MKVSEVDVLVVLYSVLLAFCVLINLCDMTLYCGNGCRWMRSEDVFSVLLECSCYLNGIRDSDVIYVEVVELLFRSPLEFFLCVPRI